MATDLFNRNIPAELPIADMMARLKAPTDNKVSRDDSSSKTKEDFERLYSVLKDVANKIDPNSDKEMQGSKNWVQKVFDYVVGQKPENNSKKDNTVNNQTAYLAIMAEATSKLWEASQSQNTLWVGLAHLTGRAQKDIAQAIDMSNCCGATSKSMSEAADKIAKSSETSSQKVQEAIHESMKSTGKSGGGSKDTLPKVESQDDLDMSQFAAGGKKALLFAIALTIINKSIQALDKTIHELELNIGRIIPSIKDANNFRESLRSIIHMQEGFGNANRNIEKQYRHITEAALAAGVSRSEYQKIYLKNLERGLSLETASDRAAVKDIALDKRKDALLGRRATRMKSIQTSALNTATMLGMSGDSMNELFMDWHYQIGLSSIELANMGRHMQQIARSSGLTGVQLEQAMQSSNAVIKNMQKQGSASLNNMKKVTEFMASAQKIGFEGSQEMITALSDGRALAESTMNSFLRQSAAMAANAGQAQMNLTMGTTLDDPMGMKNLAGGMENKIEQLFADIGGVSIDLSKDAFAATEALQRMRESGDAEQMHRALQLQNVFKAMGMPIGEAEKAVRSLNEASTPLGEKVKKAQAELDELAKKGLGNTDTYKQQQKALTDMQNGLTANAFGSMNKLQRKIESINESSLSDTQKAAEIAKEKAAYERRLLTEFGSEEEVQKFLNQQPAKAEQLLSDLKTRAKDVGLGAVLNRQGKGDLGEALKQRGITEKELLAGIQSGDEKANTILNEVMQEIATREKATQDPLTNIRDILRRIEILLGGRLDEASFSMSDTTAMLLYSFGTIGSILSNIGSWIVGLASYVIGGKILSGIGSMLFGGKGKGKGKATSKGTGGTKGSANPKGSKGTARSRGGRTRTRARGRGGRGGGRGAGIAALASLAGGYLLGSWMSGDNEEETTSGNPVVDLLTEIRDILINCCKGGGLGGGGIAGSGLPTTEVPGADDTYLSDKTLAKLDTVASTLTVAQVGVFALADTVGDSAKLTSASTKMVSSSADDALRAAGSLTTAANTTGSVASAASGGAMPSTPSTGAMPSTPSTGGTMSGVADDALKGIKAPAGAAGGGWFSNLKSGLGRAWTNASTMVSGASNYVNEKVNKVTGGIYETGKSIVKAGADKIGITKGIESLKTNIGTIVPKWLQSSGSSLGGVLRNSVQGIAKYAGPIGAVIQAAFAGMDIYEAANQKGVAIEDIEKEIGSIVIENVLGFMGGMLAASLISAPQAFGIPSWLLAPLAYMGGDWLGRQLGSLISDYIGGPTLGKWIFGLGSSMGWWPSKGERQGETATTAEKSEAIAAPAQPVPAFEVGTREIKQGGLAELHKGEMVIPSGIWDKIVAIGSGAFGAGTDVTSVFGALGKSLNPFSAFDTLRKISTGGLKTEEGQPSDIASLIVAINQLIEVIRSQKCCDVGTKLEGAFEGDQAKNALESGITSTLKLKAFKLEDQELGKSKSKENVNENMRSNGRMITLLQIAYEGLKNSFKKIDTTVTNLGVFDKEKVTEAQDYYSEGVNKSLELTNKFEPNNLTFKKMDYMEGASYPILGEYLYKTLENLKKIPQAILKPLGLGLFDNKNSDEANEMQTTALAIKQQFKAMGMPLGEYVAAVESLKAAAIEKDYKTSSDAVGLSMGLFDPEKAGEANDDYMQQTIAKSMGIPLQEFNDAIKASVANKTISEKTEKNIIAEVSKALNYDTAPSDAANQTLVTTNSLDYSDQMRGEVGSLALSRVAAESAVAQAKYGDSPSGNTAVLPSMDTIADYLVVEQARKLDQMILVMEQIRDRLSASGPMGSQIIGANTDMLAPPTRPGVKGISQDLTRGYWDLTFDDFSPGSVTTDGRGGS